MARTPKPQPVQPTTLHMVDRSRLLQGWTHCMRARFLEYHGGPTGYGLRRKSESLPLATGGAVAKGLEGIITYRMSAPKNDREDAYREVIKETIDSYRKRCLARGYNPDEIAGEDAGEVKRVVDEQSALLYGLLWGWAKYKLEPILAEYDVVCVEQEEGQVRSCSCKLGDDVGTKEDHEARGCRGILIMTRPDLILHHRARKQLEYVEFKTLGQDSVKWRKKFENNVQLALGAVGAELRLGEKIEFASVHGLVKGWRYSPADPVTGEKGKGPRMQDSVFCYAYYRPGNPPFETDTWQLHYSYIDEDGARRNATPSKGYSKVPVYQYVPIEEWCARLPQEEIEKIFIQVGPLGTPRNLVPALLRGIEGQEERIKEGLWALHDAREADDAAAVERVLDQHFPQSFYCVNEYGYTCQFYGLCHDGEDPIASGKYETRRPHHSPELAQMRERGIPLPPDQDDEIEEEGS